MKTKNVLLIGCGLLLVLGLLAGVGVVIGFRYLLQDPQGLAVELRHLQAQIKGRFFGDVDVCEGMLFLTQVADTVVE